MSLTGNLYTAQIIPESSNYWGWRGDLAEVPAFEESYTNNCTFAQAMAGFYVSGEKLVYDSDLVLAAGGTEPVDFGVYVPAKFRLPLVHFANHYRIRLGDIYHDHNVEFELFDADGNLLTPSGASRNTIGYRPRNDQYIMPVMWDGADPGAGTGDYVSTIVNVMRHGGDHNMIFHRLTDSAYAANSGTFQEPNERGWSDTPIPEDAYIRIKISFQQDDTNAAERVYREFESFTVDALQIE